MARRLSSGKRQSYGSGVCNNHSELNRPHVTRIVLTCVSDPQ
jgi:hypothetical protein